MGAGHEGRAMGNVKDRRSNGSGLVLPRDDGLRDGVRGRTRHLQEVPGRDGVSAGRTEAHRPDHDSAEEVRTGRDGGEFSPVRRWAWLWRGAAERHSGGRTWFGWN